MKKLFLSLCLTLAALNTFASDSIDNRIPLVLDGPISYTDPEPGYSRAPIRVPSVSLEGYTLYFWDSCAFTVYIKEEYENCDEQIVYTTYVPADETYIILPSELCGTYLIEVVRGEQSFIGEIEL